MTVYRTTEKSRKAKKSFTLSPESVEFLEKIRKKRRAHSASAVLEEILQAVRRGQEKKAVDKAVTDYYDSLTPEEMEEQSKWAEFALSQFPGAAI